MSKRSRKRTRQEFESPKEDETNKRLINNALKQIHENDEVSEPTKKKVRTALQSKLNVSKSYIKQNKQLINTLIQKYWITPPQISNNTNNNNNNNIEQHISSPSNTRKRTLNDTSKPMTKRRKIDANNNNHNENHNANNNENHNENNSRNIKKKSVIKRKKSRKEEMDLSDSEIEIELDRDEQLYSQTQTQTQTQEYQHANNDYNYDNNILYNSIPSAHRTLIDRAHAKFLKSFMHGYFNRHTLQIERASNFCSTAMKKFNTLQIGDYNKVDIVPVINDALPAYSMRFKHYYLYRDHKRIYMNYNQEEVAKLQTLTVDELREFFIDSGRLVDKNAYEHDRFILIRLDYNRFKKIKREVEVDEYYDSIEDMINKIRQYDAYATIHILFENVLQRVAFINGKRTGNQEEYSDVWCPYHDQNNFKDKISKIRFFRDPSIHFHFVSSEKNKIVKHVERIVKSYCNITFQAMKIRELTRRIGSFKHNRRDGKPTNQTVLKEILCLIQGVGKETADVIIEKFDTPQCLRRAYKNSNQPELLLKNEFPHRNIGLALSKKIYEWLSMNKYL
eukprot:43627_1